MRLEQLCIFVEVAETQSMSIASEHLYVTPQHVSKSIKQLEDELQTPLFKRSKHGVFLTKNGETAYDLAKEVVEKCEVLSHKFTIDRPSIHGEELEGHVTIVTSYSLTDVAYELFKEAFHHNPRVTFSCIELDPSDIIFFIDNNKPDCCFFNTDNRSVFKKLASEYEVYACPAEPLALLVGVNHPLASRQEVSLKDLCHYPMAAFYTEYIPSLFTKLLEGNNGVTLDIVFETNSYYSMIKCLKENFLCTLATPTMYHTMSECEASQLRCIPLKDSPTLKNALFISKEVHEQSIYKQLVASFADYYNGGFFHVEGDEH